MITALKKIYAFSGRWKRVLKKSVVFSLLHSIFDMFQIGALFLILNGLVEGTKGRDILFAFLLLLAGVIGKIVCSYISDFSQTRVGYFMCADKRIHVGDRMKYMPMGYFNSHSLGNLTSTVTTTISDVENNAPSVLITVIHGFIHVVVITIVKGRGVHPALWEKRMRENDNDAPAQWHDPQLLRGQPARDRPAGWEKPF